MKRIIFIALGIILLAQYSCKKVQPEMKELDCSCAKEVSADFTMEEMTNANPNFAYYTPTDTIYYNKSIRFTALEKNADYKWYVGSEIINNRQFNRFFSNAFINQTLPISLVVKKKPNKICFPNDDGYDSLTKLVTVSNITLTGPNGELNFKGQYKVKSPLLPDSTIITIDYYYLSNGNGNMLNVINYDGLGSDCIDGFGNSIYSHDLHFNYKQLFIRSFVVSKGEGINGDIKLNGNKVEMNIKTGKYVNGVYNFDAFDWKYKGRKL